MATVERIKKKKSKFADVSDEQGKETSQGSRISVQEARGSRRKNNVEEEEAGQASTPVTVDGSNPGTPLPNAAASTSRPTSSALKKRNAVEPIPNDYGSSVSLKSREAWIGESTPPVDRPSSSRSQLRPTSSKSKQTAVVGLSLAEAGPDEDFSQMHGASLAGSLSGSHTDEDLESSRAAARDGSERSLVEPEMGINDGGLRGSLNNSMLDMKLSQPDTMSQTSSTMSARDVFHSVVPDDGHSQKARVSSGSMTGTSPRVQDSHARPSSGKSSVGLGQNLPRQIERKASVKDEAGSSRPASRVGSPSTSLIRSRPTSAASLKSQPLSVRSGSAGKAPIASLASDKQPAVRPLSKNEAGPDLEHPTSRPVSRPDDNKSLSLKSSTAAAESQAYVPFDYARNCIAKVVEDMKRMKQNHIRIVSDIQVTYGAIEEETQGQFNSFVMGLRDQYSAKVLTFRQVIDVHRIELQQKQQYWDEALMSFSERNKQLLQDKKRLLIQNKVEFDRLENEKKKAVEELTVKLDTTTAELNSVTKECDRERKEKEELKEQYEVLIEDHKQCGEHQQEQIIVPVDSTAFVQQTAAAPEVEHEEKQRETPTQRRPTLEAQPIMVVTDMSEEDRRRMEEEREAMTSERDAMREDRLKMEEERDKFAEERRKHMEESIILQGEVNTSNKGMVEWKTKYENLHGQLDDIAELRAKYETLEAQMKAVSAMAIASSPGDKERCKEKAEKTQQDRDLLAEEQHQLKMDIEKWNEDFKKQNGREPTEADQSDSLREMHTSLDEVSTAVAGLDTQIQTLDQLQQGQVPEVPHVEPRPIQISEPEVKVVEVPVPDPAVVAQLTEARSQNDDLQKLISAKENDLDSLRDEVTKLRAELSETHADLGKVNAEKEALQEQMEQLRVEVSAGVAIAADSQRVSELEKKIKENEKAHEAALKEKDKEKKQMEKDMKKLIKLQMKQQKEGQEDDINVKRLLEIIVREVAAVHKEEAGAAARVESRLAEVKIFEAASIGARETAASAFHSWEHDWSEEHGQMPKTADREGNAAGKQLFAAMETASKEAEEMELTVKGLTMIQTGILPENLAPTSVETVTPTQVAHLEEKISDLKDELKELKEENAELQTKNKNFESEIEDFERQLEEAKLSDADTPSAGITLATTVDISGDDMQELNTQITDLQSQVDEAENQLQEEKLAHEATRDELEAMKLQITTLTAELETLKDESTVTLEAETSKLNSEIDNLRKKLTDSKKKADELEAALIANLPPDAKREIKAMKERLVECEKQRDIYQSEKAAAEAQNKTLLVKISGLEKAKLHAAANNEAEKKYKQLKADKDKEIKALQSANERKEAQRHKQEQAKIAAFEQKIRQLEIAAAAGGGGKEAGGGKADAKAGGKGGDKVLQDKLREANNQVKDLTAKNKQLEGELKTASKSSEADKNQKKHEKVLKELEKKLDLTTKKNEKNEANLKKRDEELAAANKNISELEKESAKLNAELASLGIAAKEGIEAAAKVENLEKEVKSLTKENKSLTENYNSERVLRKKYYNMVEDMKGKIRVYCRVRPLSKSEKDRGNHVICKSPDEYTIQCDTSRGMKDFQFDQIFMPESTQERVFEDTNNLIQSAVDGYNVCIFAYGQTGSGKTFTIIGDREQSFPGIAPRAFDRIFELLEENKSKFSYKVELYMLELYNDKLLDLFSKTNMADEKMEIKKDKKGLVVVQGAEIKRARNSKELNALFEEGSKTRHVASTSMNAESSRSHLVLGITLETTNKATGQVLKGKLSLVDLAGSERAAKTNASAEQLKEAMSINKSLSALGDVISALSSEQSFIPYRNNKLTMLMQDSLGGNAKTLMFVNISPADYNADESVVSLTYASRVKLITNDASKNADNKEIARLKGIIAKFKKGEADVEEEEI